MGAPAHWSHSQLSTLLSCGEQYRLEKVAKVPQTPAWWFIGGTVVHEVTEWWDRALFFDGPPSREALLEIYKQTFEQHRNQALEREPDESKWRRGGRVSKALPNKEDGSFWWTAGLEYIENYIIWRKTSAWPIYELPDGSPAIEVEFVITLDGIPFKGSIDRVFVPNGEPVIVDLKTGRKPDSNQQLGEYKIALAKTFELETNIGLYYLARDGKPSLPETLTVWTEPFLAGLVRKAQTMREMKLYLPKVSNLCRSCGVAAYCAAVGGAKAHEYEGIDS